MTNYQDFFIEVENNWNLTKLYQDIAHAKQKITGKNRDITPLEKVCLRGLLGGYSPNEIAATINREPRGLRVDLSRGLYRYLELLTQRPANSLKDWRNVTSWLIQANYQALSNHNYIIDTDSVIKIVDVSLSGSINAPLIDIKVRNIGSQAAFLKRARFIFNHIWLLKSWVFMEPQLGAVAEAMPLPATTRSMSKKSRQVEPSYDYKFALPPSIYGNYIEEINISQCVGDRDVDRFTFSTSIPNEYCQEIVENKTKFYTSYIYDLQIEIIYDEDNKLVRTPHILILAENTDDDDIEDRKFFHKTFTISPDLQSINQVKEYSQRNQEILARVLHIDAVKSKFLEIILTGI
ncbi:MAG: hypothetical protein QNJ63_23275 [Calothrix sp. MO_192.B10]|nr:hypothetical protein [Calothrix sp. MO_192.B10]